MRDTTVLSVFSDLVLPTGNTQRNLAPTLAGQALSFCLFKKWNSAGFFLYFLLPPFSESFCLSLVLSPFLSFILLSINSSPKLCLHGIFVSHPPRSLAQRISVDSHHLRSGPLVQKSLHLPLGPISGGFPSISGLSITASVYHSGTLKITLVSSVD